MSDLYSIIPGLQVSADEIMEAELIATQVLQAQFPDIDLRDGTGLKDLVIRPNATLLALINKAMNYFMIQNTISGVNDETPTDIVDAIMSNWFLTRVVGSRSIINARIYFARQKDISIASDVFFSPDNTLRFFSATNLSIPSASLSFDSFQNEYYYDVDLTAENGGSTYNISSGSLLYFSTFDPYMLHAEINYLKQSATDTETNAQFISRGKNAISTRNLINDPSIISKIQEDFPIIKKVQPIGMGDAEMIRDQVAAYVPSLTPPYALIHQGGMVDTYLDVPLAQGIVQLTTDADGKAYMGGAVYDFSRSQISGTAVADTLPFYLTKAVTSITRASTTATVTTTLAHGYTTGNSVTILGATQSDYNGTFTITVTGANTFTYTVANSPTTPATGTITSNIPVPYTVSNYYGQTLILTSLTSTGTTATATYNAHGLSAGRWVTISGATPSTYNGSFLITRVDQNTFDYVIPTTATSPATGTIAFTATIPATDYGFSNKAIRTIDFTNSYPNSTASFNISYFADIDGVQNYLTDQSRRVVCADFLARGFNLYVLSVNVVAYNSTAPDSNTCVTAVQSYLSTLQPGQVFVLSDMQAAISAAGVTGFQTPVTVTYTYYNRDFITKTGTITDYLDPADRTAVFTLGSLTTDSQNV